MAQSSHEITELLSEIRRGNNEAAKRLIPLVYEELKAIAGQKMRKERPNHTLQATAIVHEAFLRMAQPGRRHWESRAHFFGVAANLMRQILVDYARAHRAAKRGSGAANLSIEEELLLHYERSVDVVALDDALDRLSELDARQSRIVELRFFGGLTVEETAEVMKISSKTVKRDWSLARAWLRRELT